jgi:hypothetical protein
MFIAKYVNLVYNIYITPMPSSTRTVVSSPNHEVKVAVCFWVLVAGLALVVANALAATI